MNKEGGFIHPLLDKCLSRSPEQDVYVTEFSASRHFVLSDHRIGDKCILPGTAYIEMARVVGGIYYPDNPLELRNLVFTAPAIFEKDESRIAQVIVKKNNESISFVISSRLDSDDSSVSEKWLKHASGEIYKLNKKDKTVSLYEEKIKKLRAKARNMDIKENYPDQFINYGPRWKGCNRLYADKSGALAEFSLPPEFKNDLKDYHLHPALLDLPLIALLKFIPQKRKLKNAIPFFFKSIKIFGPIPSKFYADFSITDNGDNKEIKNHDFVLWNAKGKIIARVEGFLAKAMPDQSKPSDLNRYYSEKSYFHHLLWQKEPLKKPGGNISAASTGLVLLFAGQDSRLSAGCLKGKVITILPGQKFIKKSDHEYILGNNPKDYDSLLTALDGKPITRIIHAFALSGKTINTEKDLATSQENGVMSLFRLVKSLRYRPETIDIVLLTGPTAAITGREKRLCPENATIAGLGKTVTLENPNLRCRSIDIDSQTNIGNILKEIDSPYCAHKIAYRNNHRYIEVLNEFDINALPKKKIDIKEGNVYLITGGLGALGLEVAKYISGQAKVKLVLVSRAALPPRGEWENIIRGEGQTGKIDDKLISKLRTIKEIEKNGSEIMTIAVDVADREGISRAIGDVRRKYSQINGIIHAAGVAGNGFIINKDEKTFERVLMPKVKGTWLLDRLTRRDGLDFFICFSSITAVLSAPGQGDYTAANAYLDAFVQIRDNAFSLDWAAWRDVGMAVDNDTDTSRGPFQPLHTSEAIEIFAQILARNPVKNSIIIGKMDNGRFESGSDRYSFVFSGALDSRMDRDQIVSKRPTSISVKQSKSGKTKRDYTEAESKIASVWQDILGYKEIDINGNFFEIGGDSLMLIQVYKKLEKIYHKNISMLELFMYPTIAKLADHLGRVDRQPLITSKDENIKDKLYKIFKDMETGNLSAKEAEDNIRRL